MGYTANRDSTTNGLERLLTGVSLSNCVCILLKDSEKLFSSCCSSAPVGLGLEGEGDVDAARFGDWSAPGRALASAVGSCGGVDNLLTGLV